MYGGIDQLVNTYKGNPQPLAQKVQSDQQKQSPGAIPPDLEEALALQQITELRNSAQGQQAMQAGGAQPSVVQKLRQMLGTQTAQAQPPMPQQPVMAAHGGSIDQLISNLGHNYAGGGIVAFQSAGQVKDPNAEEDTSSQFVRDISKLPEAFDAMKQRAREEDAVKAAQDARMAKFQQDKLAAQQKTSLFNYLFGSPQREQEGTAKLAELSSTPVSKAPAVPAVDPAVIREQLNKADAAQFAQKPAAKVPTPTGNPAAPAAPRPTVVNPGIAGAGKPEVVEPTDPLEAAIRKSAMDVLAKDPEEVRRRAIEANAKAMGLDALLKPAQERVANREAMVRKIQESRQPLWIDALMSAGKPTKGGIAGVLNQMATGVNATKQGYDVEDLRFIDELNKLNEGIDKARIEGRYKDVAAGEAAVKDLIADKRQAEQSGTSLLTNKETARSREQIAKEGRLSREQTAALAAQGRADALAGKTDVAYREQAMKLAMAAALKEMQLPANMVKYKNTTAEELAATKFNSIYNALKSGKMGAAPSAESPSGTPPDVQALLNKYGGK
jgi:hypothetical protein